MAGLYKYSTNAAIWSINITITASNFNKLPLKKQYFSGINLTSSLNFFSFLP